MKAFLTLLFLVFYFVSDAQLYFPPTNENWETVAPTSLNWCDEQLDDLYDFLADRDTKAFIILKEGRIAVEWYFDDFTQDSIWYWASAGKSLMATLVGIAEQEGHLAIQNATHQHLGQGWTDCDTYENDITIRHQLSMTSGLDDRTSFDCTTPECLTCLVAPNTRWAYHNGPYSLLREVVEAATGAHINAYYANKIGNVIGASGLYVKSGFNNLFLSTPRAMARFGLLMLAEGQWGNTTILNHEYFQMMIQPSQNINPAYGYLWWLNGQEKFKQPRVQTDFQGSIIPTAPADLFAAMGRNEQRAYIVPSEDLVVIRMGDNADDPNALALSGFDTDLWGKIMDLECPVTNLVLSSPQDIRVKLFPNPSSKILNIDATFPIAQIVVSNALGKEIMNTTASSLDISNLTDGIYTIQIKFRNGFHQIEKFLKTSN